MTESEAREIVEKYEALAAFVHAKAGKHMGFFPFPILIEGGRISVEKPNEFSPNHYIEVPLTLLGENPSGSPCVRLAASTSGRAD